MLATLISLLVSPLCFLGFLYSVYTIDHPSVCGLGHSYSMPAMWLIMALAHSLPWINRWKYNQLG